MYRNTQHKSASAAKDYYKSHLGQALGDYYSEKKTADSAEMIGQVHGKLADQLGLSGTMTQEQFFDLIDNTNPVTKERLTQRTNGEGNRRVGFDLYFDTGGKSISTYFARTQDPLVLKLFDEAVQEVMSEEIEPRMFVRVRQDGQNTSRQVSNALYTTFTHLTTRPTKVKNEQTNKWEDTGTADPHIHQHVYLMNAAFDAEYRNRDGTRGAVLAAEITDGIWNNAAYIQKNFHARLAKKFRDAGFNVERTEHGIDLVGWNDQMGQTFSRRQGQIEEWAAANGITYGEDKGKGGKATRSSRSKMKLTMKQQFNEWRSRLAEDDWDAFIESAQGESGDHWPDINETQAIDYALAHSLERDNSATVEEVLYAALDRGMGSIDVDKLKHELNTREDVIQARIGRQTLVTTQERLELEKSVRDWAIHGQGTCLPLAASTFELKPFDVGNGKFIELNSNQREAIQTLLRSTSRMMTLRGAPGTGKTTALSQLIAGVEDNGGRVVPIGSTSNARDQMIEDGQAAGNVLATAENLAKFLNDKHLQATLNSKSLVVLDEATLAGLEDIKKLCDIVESKGARLLAVGDFRQMQSVPANGKIFEQLHNKLLSSADITEIVRQKDSDYRKAVDLLASRDSHAVQAGFDRLVKLGFVREIDQTKDRTEQAAQAYVDITGEKTSNRGRKLDWSREQKQDPAMYRSGMTVVLGTGRHAQKKEIIGRKSGRVMAADVDRPDTASPLDLSDPGRMTVYEAQYTDALLVVGTHKEGNQVSRKIRELRKQSGELGIEKGFTRLVNTGFSVEEKKLKQRYEPGMVVEFGQKATTKLNINSGPQRNIWYGERFRVEGPNARGDLMMTSPSGESLLVPLEHSNRFEVYREKPDKVAIGDRIRMTKNGRTLAAAGDKQGIRFSNNEVFTVKDFDRDGNPVIGNDRRLPKDFGHFRSGYYATAIGGQGSDASHAIILDSRQAGRSRSTESTLVAISRGKRAATLLTDDIKHYRNYAITRSSQRPSATQLSTLVDAHGGHASPADASRLADQQRRLQRVGAFAKQAAEAAMQAIAQGRRQLAAKLAHIRPETHREAPS